MEVFSTKKKFLLTLGASALTIAAISAASFGVHREAVEAKAVTAGTSKIGLLGTINGTTNWSQTQADYALDFFTWNSSSKTYTLTIDLKVNDDFKIFNFTTKKWGGWNGNLTNGQLSGTGWESNIAVNATGTFTITMNSNADQDNWNNLGSTWSYTYAEPSETYHTITFDYGYKVFGGSDNVQTTDQVVEGAKISAPTRAIMAGKTATWYHGETAWNFSTDVVTSDITLTARWTDAAISSYKTVYYVLDSNDSIPTRVYTYGGNEMFGTFGGAYIPSSDVTSVLHYNGGNTSGNAGKIVKVTYPADATDDHIIFNVDGSGSWKTKDLVLHDGYAYYGDADIDGSADRGLAVSLAYDIEEARNAVTASGTVKDYSICGISQSSASAFVTRYNALGDTYKAEFDATTTYTYNPDDLNNETNVTFANIMVTLTNIADQNGSNGRILLAQALGKESNAIGFSVIALLLASTLVITAGIVVKKKKQK